MRTFFTGRPPPPLFCGPRPAARPDRRSRFRRWPAGRPSGFRSARPFHRAYSPGSPASARPSTRCSAPDRRAGPWYSRCSPPQWRG